MTTIPFTKSAFGAALATALLLPGCALRSFEWQNPQPRQEVLQAAKPPGSVYTGWRVFQERCAGCHGTAATGGNGGPDLTQRVRGLGPHRFVDLVLRRYDWNLPPAQAGTPRETLIDEIVSREKGAVTMPAWQGEPIVSAHIADLYAYLSGRPEGTQGPGRPAP